MIGLQFKRMNEYNKFLGDILQNVKSQKKYWHIIENEVLDSKGNDLFFKTIYDDESFKRIVDQVHYPIFLKICLFNDDKKNKIDTYEDFENGECNLLLIVTDCEYVEIYAKSEELLKQIEANAKRANCFDIRYIEKNTITRKFFSSYRD